MYPTISIAGLHLEYQLWVAELNFSVEEIGIFEKHLARLLEADNTWEVAAQAERFQNQFIRHREVIDVLRHDLHVSERQLAAMVRKLSGDGIEQLRMDNHIRLRDEMRTFRRIYQDLKEGFRRFVADNL